MTDLTQILAGNVDEVTKALAPLTVDQLTELKALEETDKNRKGVLTAIAAAIAALATASAEADDVEPAPVPDEIATQVETGATETAELPDASIDPVESVEVDAPPVELEPFDSIYDPVETAAPADEPVTAEAPAAAGSVIDMAHFAVDTNLRAGTTIEQNRIDFNDPRLDGREVVEAALTAQAQG